MRTTPSVRLPDDSRLDLAIVASRLQRGEILEARRQSLLASEKERANPELFVQEIADTTGWV